MPCYHPLKGFIIGKNASGKDKLKITSYDVHHLERPDESRSYFPVYEKGTVWKDVVYPTYDIPCGHCIGCRLDRSRDWANRCLIEMQKYESNLFITLTYDDSHIPYSTGIDRDTGEMFTTTTLVKRDWQLFMKRLRKWYESFAPAEKLRFFMCGEYGSTTFRPHYHAIIFNLKLPDLVWYKRSGEYDYYTSEVLSSLWSDGCGDPKGFVVVAPATWETAAYTARYITKKLSGPDAQIYEDLGILPEFCLMSRRPGIAGDYVEENAEHLLDFDQISVSTSKGGRSFPPPKYFKRKFDLIFEDHIGKMVLRDSRQDLNLRLMESMKVAEMAQTDLSYLDLLAVAEHAKIDQVKGLERSL